MTARERFLAMLYNGPLLKSDFVVCLCGEDAMPRLHVTAEIMASRGALNVVLSGGVHEPPARIGADALAPKLMGMGVAHDKIHIDGTTKNTRDQAVNTVALALKKDWRRILLVASAYHLPRAFLTFLRALEEADATERIHIVPVPVSHTPWTGSPAGVSEVRLDLLWVEFDKIYKYAEHVADYQDGTDYLAYWETAAYQPEEEVQA